MDTTSHDKLILRIEQLEKRLARRQAELEALRQSEEKYHRLFENADAAIFLLQGGRFVDCNPMTLDMFACSREQILHESPRRFSPKRQPDGTDSAAAAAAKISAALAGSPQFFEWRHVRYDGSPFDAEVSLRRIEISGEVYLLAVIRDISARKKMQDSLRRSEEEYRTLVENLNVGVYRNTVEPQGRFLKANPAMAEIFGFDSVEEILATPVADLYLNPEDRLELIAQLKANGSVRGRHLQLKKKDGTALWIATTATLRYNSRGEATWIDGVSEDISERIRAEEALHSAHEILENIFECSPAAIVCLDRDRKVTLWNTAAEHIFGWKREEVIGKPYPAVPETEQPERMQTIAELVDGGGVKKLELTRQRKDGTLICISASAAPLRDARGEIIGLVSVMDDITERKRASEALQKAQAETEAVNRELEAAIAKANEMAQDAEFSSMAKSQFLANMSHEIRTPLNGVIGFTDMLLDTDLDENQRDYTLTIKRSGEALLSLINDILDFSKIEAGELDFEEIAFDPELLAYDICDLIRPRIDSRAVEILCRIGDDVPPRVKGDPLRFRQVLTNLMGNASKFTKRGEIELQLDIESQSEARIKFHATVRDTGIGIAADKLEEIFFPFQQADGSTTRKYGGTGLGLSICRKIANLMEGDVWAESPVERPTGEAAENTADDSAAGNQPGSIFHFTGWLKKAGADAPARPRRTLAAGCRVLVVDDSRASRQILNHILSATGMRPVALAETGSVMDTLQAAADAGDPFGCCLCDVEMPGTSGYELAAQIRSSKHPFHQLPLIALSATTERDAGKCQAAGFDAFLTKPVRREKLYQIIERVLSPRRTGEEAQDPPQTILTQYSVREDIKRAVRILLVEDNPVNQKLAQLMLTKAGYGVEVAASGREAIDKYSADPGAFDLIFMDIQMPDMDGLQATEAIRRLQHGHTAAAEDARSHFAPARIPIVAMTAHAMKGDRERCLEAGMDDYITKPIQREKVLGIIKKWVLPS